MSKEEKDPRSQFQPGQWPKCKFAVCKCDLVSSLFCKEVKRAQKENSNTSLDPAQSRVKGRLLIQLELQPSLTGLLDREIFLGRETKHFTQGRENEGLNIVAERKTTLGVRYCGGGEEARCYRPTVESKY